MALHNYVLKGNKAVGLVQASCEASGATKIPDHESSASTVIIN